MLLKLKPTDCQKVQMHIVDAILFYQQNCAHIIPVHSTRS